MYTTVILMDTHVIQHYTADNPNGFEERYVPTSVATNFDPIMCTRTMSVAVSSTLSISSQFTMEMLCIKNLDIMTTLAPRMSNPHGIGEPSI